MSNQVGDCFKFMWPFQNVRTLLHACNDVTISVLENVFHTEMVFVNLRPPIEDFMIFLAIPWKCKKSLPQSMSYFCRFDMKLNLFHKR